MTRPRAFAKRFAMSFKKALAVGAGSAVLLVASGAHAASPLGAYTIDPSTVTVAGISSGGFMAVQLQVAYSARFHGAAVFAGGPYDCAAGSLSNAGGRCTTGSGIPLTDLYAFTDDHASKGDIDPTTGLAGKPIYMFSGTLDGTVQQPVMNALEQFYEHYTPPSNITYDKTTAAGHAWITPSGPGACGVTQSPFMNDCGKDAEQTFLGLFYGSLAAKNAGTLGGALVTFDQDAFCPGNDCSAIDMDSTARAFVPASCAAGAPCKLVVALHGCSQNQGFLGDTFVIKSGINPWADTNRIVVVYPQTIATGSNPLGCWDFWGYTGASYALKSAPQMRAIVGMVDRLLGVAPTSDGGAADGGVGDAAGSSDAAGAIGEGGAGGDGGAPSSGGGDGSDCGCRAVGSRSTDRGVVLAWLALGLLVYRRRRAI